MSSSVIGALRVNLGIDSAQFQQGLKQAQSGLKRFGALAKQGLMVVGAAAVAAAGAMTLAVKGTIDAADEMSKASQKIGIPIDELSRLKYAADLSGVSFEGLQTAVGRLSRVMNDAKNGSAEAVETFDQIGISATNADGSLKSASQVMAEIADKFATMPEGAEKTALAMELMGRSGADMIPMLNGGAEALNKLMAEADTFGQVFTAEMGAQAEAFNDNISRLQGVFANIAAQLATALLPHLAAFTDWLVANAPAITALIVKLVEFAAAVIKLGSDIVGFITGAWAAFEAAWDGTVMRVHAVKDALIELGRVGLEAMEAMVNGIVDWVGNKLNAAWDGVVNKIDWVSGKFESLYDAVVGHSWIPDMVEGIGDWMGRLDGLMVKPAEAAADSVSGAFKDTGDAMADMFSGFGSSIAAAIRGTKEWGDVVADGLEKIAGKLFDSGLNAIFGGGGGLGGLFKGLFGGLLGFKDGGSFTVGGAGGIDSQVVAFRATPGETVDVRKAGQGAAGGGAMTINVNVDGANGDAHVIALVRQGVAAGIGQYDRGLSRSMPARMADAQMRAL